MQFIVPVPHDIRRVPEETVFAKKGLTPSTPQKGAVSRWMGTAMAAGLNNTTACEHSATLPLITPYRAAAVKWEEQVLQFWMRVGW